MSAPPSSAPPLLSASPLAKGARHHWSPSAISGDTVWAWAYKPLRDERWSSYVEVKRMGNPTGCGFDWIARVSISRIEARFEATSGDFRDHDLEAAMIWAEKTWVMLLQAARRIDDATREQSSRCRYAEVAA